jgi:predicted acyltransferase
LTIATTQNRLLSLDVFRGMTIAFMILVNTPGTWSHVYPPLLHAKWHGATPTDMVFPFFLFIVGITLYLSASKFDHQLSAAASKKVLKRTLLIFLIGLSLNWFPFTRSFENLRIMGVLQRIALAYGIGAFICLGLPLRQLWKPAALLLLGYWVLMIAFGGADPYSLENNLGLKIDRFLLGENHLYGGFGIKFDPEGLFSTLPAVGTVIFGYYVGALIRQSRDTALLVKNLLLTGVVAIFAGLVWDLYFPINKALWTSSYVLYAGGIACCFLAVLIELIDIRGYKRWTRPFQVFGLNPLIIYVLSGVLVKVMLYLIRWENAAGNTRNAYSWLYNEVFASLLPNQLKLASLLFALSIVGFCWLVGYGLYKKKIVIKV